MEIISKTDQMKSNHPDYAKIHSREQYKKNGALKTVCAHCGATVSVKAMIVHRRTERCMNFVELRDERYHALLEELKSILKFKGITLINFIDTFEI
jgi:hypothetical protein